MTSAFAPRGILEVNMSSAFRFQDIFVRGVQDPYPFYDWLRTEAPVYWNAEIVPAWFISRYDDVVAITEDDRRLTLLRHPDQLALLKKDPVLIGGAVEECLRYDSLILGFPRVATEDVNVRGQLIHKGQQVFPLLRSANRDPVRFPDPDRLDITRQDLGQLSFGHGVHYCLGAPLARLLAQIGISTLVQRLSGLQLAADTLEYRKHFNFRALLALPISFQPAS
jgi:cytochrome P450